MSAYHFFDTSNTGLSKLLERINRREREVKKELAAALNKAAREVVNLSRDEWNAFATTDNDYVKKRLDVRSGATENRLQAKVSARTRATRANRFRYHAMPGRKGVMLNVKRGSAGAVLNNAFVVRAKSDGKPLVLERLKKHVKGDKGFGGKRFKAVYGPSINQHFADSKERVAPQALSAARRQFLEAMRNR